MPPSIQPKKHQNLILVALLTLFTLVSVGCGTPKQGQPGGPAPAVIEIWHSLQGAEAKVLEKEAENIMNGHPEVLIRLEYVPEANFVKHVFYAQTGGEGPEIFITSGNVMNKLYSEGALAPTVGESDSFAGTSSQFRYGKSYYAQPIVADVPLFYYRTDMAQPPSNLEDLLNLRGKLVLPHLNSQYLSAWWNGQGGKLTNKGQLAINDLANIAFLGQISSWRTTNRITIDPNAWQQFLAGDAAYTIAWASNSKNIAQTIPWQAIPLTNISGGKGQILPGRIIAIANSSIKTTEEMSPFISLVEEELLSSESQWKFAQAGGRFPVNPAFYSTTEAQQGIFPKVKQSLENTWALQGNDLEWKLIPIQDMMWQNVWNGIEPTDALNHAQGEAMKIIGQK